ncbi:MAG: hypothetical protein KIS92_04495 [Planctomycetota bacterium]|nr:hypothetical protein [Planctomycetota bacterium]
MAMDTYTLFAVNIDGTLIDGITNQAVSTGLQMALNKNDGSPHIRFAGAMAGKPTIRFTTKAIAKALAAVGALGASIGSSITFFFQKTAESGLRAGSGAHLKIVGSAGLVVPRTLRASQDQEAEIEYEYFPVSADGSTAPLTITTGQSLSGSPDSAQKFTVGPAKINGTNVQPQSIEIDFGLNVVTRSHSGFFYLIRAHIDSAEPKIKVTTLDAGVLATYTLAGTAQSSTDSVYYFRKLLEGGARTADGTGEHVSITVDEGIITVPDVNAAEGSDAQATVQEDVSYDGSNLPLVISTTATIS